MRKCKRCCLWALPLALLLGVLAFAVGKNRIDNDFTGKSRVALDTAGLTGVSTKSDWGGLTLRGPLALKTEALTAVAGMKNFSEVHNVRYVDDLSAAPTTTTTAAATTSSAAPTTVTTTAPAPSTTAAATTTSTAAATTVATTVAPAPVSVDVTADAAAKSVTLTGFVATDAAKASIVNAAVAAFGQANVIDQLTVKAGTPAAGVDGAVNQLATVIGAFGTKVDKGTAHLSDTKLTITGTGFTSQAATDANALIDAAKAAGVTVNGTIAAPAVPDSATLQARLRDLLGRSGINFASGSPDITAESQGILDTAAQSILLVPGVNLQVAGHTDNVGSASSNQTLSQQRADAVRQYLVGKGVPAGQLTAAGFGASQPIAANDAPEGRAQNRRIEFNVQ